MHDSRLSNLLGAAALSVADQLTAAASRAAGTSVSAAAALVTLTSADGIGVTELGRRIGLSQPACARMLDQLAAHGYIRRDPARARVVAVHLTEAGQQAAAAARRARQELLDRMLARLGPTERAALREALEPLLAVLHDEVGSEDLVCRLCDRRACLAEGHVCPVGLAARTQAADTRE